MNSTKPSQLSTNAGFGLVEILVVTALVGIVFISFMQLITLTSIPIQASSRETTAVYLAEESIESVRVLRNDSWTNNISPLTNGTPYYPVVVSSNWTLTTTDPGPIDGTYTRTITLSAVNRDANDDIAATGTQDPNTRLITSTVTWPERNRQQTVQLDAYITNFLDN